MLRSYRQGNKRSVDAETLMLETFEPTERCPRLPCSARQGTLRLSAEVDPELFELARVGLGALGVVAEVTLQCVPAHQLLEHTYVSTLKARGGPG